MRSKLIALFALCVVTLGLAAASAGAQVQRLYYREVVKDGRVYVFNTPERYKAWQASGDMGAAVTLVGRGQNGETIVAENETAIDLYLFKHNLEAYDGPTPAAAPAAAAPSGYPKTVVGGRIYADLTSKTNKDEGAGTKSNDSGTGVDVKRFYFGVQHDFDATWSAKIVTDIGDQGQKRYDVFVKNAFLQAKVRPEAIFRLGAADEPWIPWVESIYGMRYFEQTLIDRTGFGYAADWGLHFLGSAANGMVGYQFSAINGKGYSNPTRTKSMEFEGRVNFSPINGLYLAVGGYTGKLGNETDTTPAQHTAQRLDALVAYNNDHFRIGGEYFSADNFRTVTSTSTDKADGYDGWFGVSFTKEWSVIGRYDHVKPSKDLKPALEDTFYTLGVQYQVSKNIAGVLAYKHEEVKGGTFSVGGNTIGSTNLAVSDQGKLDEVGVWMVYNFNF